MSASKYPKSPKSPKLKKKKRKGKPEAKSPITNSGTDGDVQLMDFKVEPVRVLRGFSTQHIKPTHRVKICMLGSSAVGKTSLLSENLCCIIPDCTVLHFCVVQFADREFSSS